MPTVEDLLASERSPCCDHEPASAYDVLFATGAGDREEGSPPPIKTVNVAAPVEVVSEFWSDYTRFPQFRAHVRDVQDRGEGRSHWVVAEPAGVPVEWDAVVTKRVPNEMLAWKTVPAPRSSTPGPSASKRTPTAAPAFQVRMSYNPPAGALGHGVAFLFGADPKSEMDADLARMKTLIETGVPPRDAAQPTRHTSSR